MKYAILDCYVDEPACLGVPPFIAPYGRSIYGALIDSGVAQENITFLTIDDLRLSEYKLIDNYKMAFIFGGAVVPGRYLGARIGTAAEMEKIFISNTKQRFAAGGPITTVLHQHDNVHATSQDIEYFAYNIAKGDTIEGRRSLEQLSKWNKAGSEIVKHHPWYPNIICEVETSRGCPREHHCSFCSEGLFGAVEFRSNEDILNEIKSLIDAGVTRIRLGRQADILQHGSLLNKYSQGFPQPNESYAIELFDELKKIRQNGDLEILNIDNANPGTITSYPEESKRIIRAIAQAVSPGDTMALGVESFDPTVVAANNLKVAPERVIDVIEIINEAGCERVNGIPRLLPGINIIHGLRGENKKTFEMNYKALLEIVEKDLLIKRINIRQLTPYPGTAMENSERTEGPLRKKFEYYRNKIRDDIDIPLMEKIYPVGTIIEKSYILDHNNEYSYGKEISSYAITARFPEKIPIKTFIDALVIGHRERSITTLPVGQSINELSVASLRNIPGISKKGADDIVLRRPFKTMEEAKPYLEYVTDELKNKLVI